MSDLDNCIDSKPNNNTGMHFEKHAARLLPLVQCDPLSALAERQFFCMHIVSDFASEMTIIPWPGATRR